MLPPVLLATASYDRTIRFWEAPSGICIRTLNFQDSQVNCMCTSPDKAFLAAAGHKHIRLYELGASSQVPASTIEAHSSNVTAIQYFRDGRYLVSGSEDGTVKMWDMRSMARRRQYVVKSAVNCLALHPDQSLLLVGDQSGRLSLWDTLSLSDSCVQELVPGGDVAIRSVSVSSEPGGPICACNNSGDVFVLELVDTSAESEDGSGGGGGAGGAAGAGAASNGAESAGEAVAAAEGGEAADASCSGEGKQRRLRLVHVFRAHNKYILKCALSPDSSLLATCSADYTIGLWHTNLAADGHKPWTSHKTLVGHLRWVWDCAFSGDGKHLASASSDNTGKLWDVAKGVDIMHLTGHHKPVTCIVVDDRATSREGQPQATQ